ncbi:DUF4339 domain-containing protein [Flavobacteriaceae bacterium]|nr:DUF4339 domain-containing protein [Flavobacteriaceae bacterium]
MDNNMFSSVDKLVEFGIGMSMAQQMMNVMNQSMNQMQTPQFKNTDVPLVKERQYHVVLNDIPQGPLSKNQILTHLNNGDLNDENLIWCDGMSGWSKIKDISI